MRYHQINNQLFIKNREKFMSAMNPSSIAVFNSNDIYPVGADSTLPFQQARDLFYLSGADQEETILLLFPDALEEKHREILSFSEANDHIQARECEKLTKEKAFEVSGIKCIYWLDEYTNIFHDIITEANTAYFNTNEHYQQYVETEPREDQYIKWCKQQYPAH